MKIKYYLFWLMMLLIFAGCSIGTMVPTNYYILEYFTHMDNEQLIQSEPLDYSVVINNANIPQNYNRKQIVIRHFGPKITYANNDLWGTKLSEIIPDLISKKLTRYNLFRQTQREFLNEQPDLFINIKINNIEFLKSTKLSQARLNMDIVLKESETYRTIIKHSVNSTEELHIPNIENFVIKINNIILQETDQFVKKTLNHYKQTDFQIEKEEKKSQDKSQNIYVQSYDTGMGSVILPALTGTDYEPYYTVKQRGKVINSARMGTEIPLPAGNYDILYGSGNVSQMMMKPDVKIYPRYKTMIEPDWTCLTIDVMDENRNYAKAQYEIFDAETGVSYGTDFPADEEIGEQQKIWVLEPGLYKICLNNEPFNTYTNYTTIFLKEGKAQSLRIVVDRDEQGNPTNLLGAGIVTEDEYEKKQTDWKFYSAIHGNINLNSSNETEKDNPETNITLNGQLDNKLTYKKSAITYTLKNLIEIGTNKANEEDFHISSDDFDLKNTLIYYFIKDIGLYSRLDLNTHVFTENYLGDSFNARKYDVNDNLISEKQNVDKVRIKPSLFPLVIKEGLGINWRVLNIPKANLNLRTGFGLRQDFNNNYFVLSNSTETDTSGNEYKVFEEQESIYKRGVELSLIGNFRLPFNLSYFTDADALIPFDKDDAIIMEWENILNMKLTNYISLDYKLNLINKDVEDEASYIIKEHSLFLRITYFLR